MGCLRSKELNHSLKVRQLKREKFELRRLLLSGSNMPGNWIYYPILPIILLMWGSVQAGIETLKDRKMKQGHFVMAGGKKPQRSSKRCGFVVRYCSRNVKVWWKPGVTETMWVKQTASFPFGRGTALSTEGPSINPLSAAFLCLRFFLSWEFTSDKLGNSLRRWVFLLPSDALRAAERIQRFTNELPLYSTVCFEIFSLNLFHK